MTREIAGIMKRDSMNCLKSMVLSWGAFARPMLSSSQVMEMTRTLVLS